MKIIYCSLYLLDDFHLSILSLTICISCQTAQMTVSNYGDKDALCNQNALAVWSKHPINSTAYMSLDLKSQFSLLQSNKLIYNGRLLSGDNGRSVCLTFNQLHTISQASTENIPTHFRTTILLGRQHRLQQQQLHFCIQIYVYTSRYAQLILNYIQLYDWTAQWDTMTSIPQWCQTPHDCAGTNLYIN